MFSSQADSSRYYILNTLFNLPGKLHDCTFQKVNCSECFVSTWMLNVLIVFSPVFTETHLLACLVDYFDKSPDFKRWLNG